MCNYCDKNQNGFSEALVRAKMEAVSRNKVGLWYTCPLCKTTGIIPNAQMKTSLDYAKMNRVERRRPARDKLVYNRFGQPYLVREESTCE